MSGTDRKELKQNGVRMHFKATCLLPTHTYVVLAAVLSCDTSKWKDVK